MPSQFELYRVRGDELNDDFFNVRFRNIDARLTHLEASLLDIDAIAESLVSRGLDILQIRLNQAVAEIEQHISSIDELAQKINAQIQDLEEVVDGIIGGGTLPAASITLSAIDGLEADDVQEALEFVVPELLAVIELAPYLQSELENKANKSELENKANISSPTFSGTPRAPTPPSTDSSTRIATTAFVKGLLNNVVPTSRQVFGGGLVSGGGDLAQDRTLTVTAAGASDFRGGVDNTKALTTKSVYDAAAFQTASFSSTITLNFANGINWEITASSDFILANPQNAKPGQSGCIKINTGGPNRNIIYGNAWVTEGGAQDLSAGNTTDYLMFYVVNPSLILYTIMHSPE